MPTNNPQVPPLAPSGLSVRAGSAILCESCGYSGVIDSYLPSMSAYADCRCPKCGSTKNQHNADYSNRLRKAWSCKHVETLVDAGRANGHLILKCTECGCVGLDWAMRGERPPLQNIAVSQPGTRPETT